jgi:hypothetical protein
MQERRYLWSMPLQATAPHRFNAPEKASIATCAVVSL